MVFLILNICFWVRIFVSLILFLRLWFFHSFCFSLILFPHISLGNRIRMTVFCWEVDITGTLDIFTAVLHIAWKCVSKTCCRRGNVRVVLNRAQNCSMLSFIQQMFKIAHMKEFSPPRLWCFERGKRKSFLLHSFIGDRVTKTNFRNRRSCWRLCLKSKHAGVHDEVMWLAWKSGIRF